MNQCSCYPEFKDGYKYVKWISVFGDCVYSPLEVAGFISGLLNIFLFFFALIPQLWKNYKRKRVEGLSLAFLTIWIFGDVCNTLGAFLTNQYPLMKYTGIYFICSDLVSLSQYFYYSVIYKGPRPTTKFSTVVEDLSQEEYDDFDNTQIQSPGNGISDCHVDIASYSSKLSTDTTRNDVHQEKRPTPLVNAPFLTYQVMIWSIVVALIPTATAQAYMVLSENLPACDDVPEIHQNAEFLGQILAWVSGLLYFFSRVPQIAENYRLKSVEGLSVVLFMLTISSNLCYGFQIISKRPQLDAKFFNSILPYLIGSVGTLIFDSIILFQAILYGNNNFYNPISKIRNALNQFGSNNYAYQPVHDS